MHAHRTGPPEDRFENLIGSRPMVSTIAVSSSLEHDDRFCPRQSAQRRHEKPRCRERRLRPHRLDIEQNSIGVRIVRREVEQLCESDVGARTQRDDRRETDGCETRKIEQCSDHRPRLRDQRESAGQCDRLAVGRVQSQ